MYQSILNLFMNNFSNNMTMANFRFGQLPKFPVVVTWFRACRFYGSYT